MQEKRNRREPSYKLPVINNEKIGLAFIDGCFSSAKKFDFWELNFQDILDISLILMIHGLAQKFGKMQDVMSKV